MYHNTVTSQMRQKFGLLRRKLLCREGFGTLEVVIIIAVLLAIALIFRKALLSFAQSLIDAVFKKSIISDLN